MRPPDPVRSFARAALLWMPVTLGLWWQGGWYYFVQLLAPLVKASLLMLVPDYYLGFHAMGSLWYFHTQLSPLDDPLALLSIPITPVRYTATFALFWGLSLATPIPWRERGYQLLVGTALVVLPAVLFMVVVSTLFNVVLTVNHQPLLAQQPPQLWFLAMPWSDDAFYLLGVGRQLSTLVLPLLVPVLTWAGFNAHLVRRNLLRWRARYERERRRNAPKPKLQPKPQLRRVR